MKHLIGAVFFFTLAWLSLPNMRDNATIKARPMEVAAEYARLDNIPLHEMDQEMAAEALKKARIERTVEQAVARMKASTREAGATPTLSSLHARYLNAIVKDLYRILLSVRYVLGTITDIESANTALPSLEAASSEVDALLDGMNSSPPMSRKPIRDVVSAGMFALEPLIEKANAIPGVEDVIGRVLTPMLRNLEKMGG